MSRKPIAIGAEAVLYLEDWLGLTVLVKERVPKGYRGIEFDNYIRRSRTINEARAMLRLGSWAYPCPGSMMST
ncbi:hypothetical protein [Vulcanisaeta sp. JCM 16159]|uniref:hypothetical protein n=1 Tax=Vulcanisaeta sp. JCM 16159 TaxID=1295371 RepID=UPI000AA51CF3|nr:hypothetical protein [Vulcanisaeta sp. JCM 16159]